MTEMQHLISVQSITSLHPGSQWRYDVQVVYPAGVTGSWAAGLTDQTAASLTDNLTNTTDVVQTVIYTFTPHIRPGDGGPECQNGVPEIVTVDLDPQPRIDCLKQMSCCAMTAMPHSVSVLSIQHYIQEASGDMM